MQQQFVGLVRRGLAIVARDAQRHITRDHRALEQIDFTQNFFSDGDGVRAGAFGNAQGHRRFLDSLAAVQDILRGLFSSINDLSHLPQIDGAAAENAHHHVAHVFRRLQKGAGFHKHLAVAGGEAARTKLPVGLLEHRHQTGRTQVARGQFDGIKQHPNCAARSTQQGRLGDQRHLFDGFLHLRGKPPQRQVIIAAAVERQRQDGHVVDALRLDQRSAHAHRNTVKIGVQLVRQLHQAALRIFAYLEAHDYQALTVARGGVDVFHAWHFPEQLFHWPGGPLLHFLGGGTGHGDHHIHHWHLDLRLFLTRQQDDGRASQQHRCDDDQRREFRIDECCRDAARNTQRWAVWG